MTTNVTKYYMNLDGTRYDIDNTKLLANTNNTNIIQVITPFSNSLTLRIAFQLADGRDIGYKTLTYSTTEVVEGETWNVYEYAMTDETLSVVTLVTSSPLTFSVNVRELDPDYLDAFSTLTALQTAYPTAEDGQHATVGLITATSYEWQTDEWVDLGYVKSAYLQEITSEVETLYVTPTVSGSFADVSGEQLEIVYNWLEGTFGEDIEADTLTLGGGTLSWNSEDGTIDLAYDGVALQIGQEQHFYGKQFQTQISNGEPLAFAGVEGNHFRLTQFLPNAMADNPETFVGVATNDFPTQDDGYVKANFGYATSFGFVRDFDTDELVDNPSVGAVIWLNPDYDGTTNTYYYTTTHPSPLQLRVRVAVIVEENQNQNQLGTIFVRPTVFETQANQGIYYPETLPESEDDYFEGMTFFDTDN
jgi:hypothetical protein